MDKRAKKRRDKWCGVCGEDNMKLLDVHRITPGSAGGRYTEMNSVTLCCRCHRLTHASEIVIDRIYNSTAGPMLHYFKEGVEMWSYLWRKPVAAVVLGLAMVGGLAGCSKCECGKCDGGCVNSCCCKDCTCCR